MNQVIETIQNRFSCRGYINKFVSSEDIKTIAKAGLHAATANNKQPFKILVVSEKEKVDAINAEVLEYLKNLPDKKYYEQTVARGGSAYYDAPVLYVIVIEKDNASAPLDAGIVVGNMSLAATSLGIDNVIAAMLKTPFEGDNGDKFKKLIGWPEGYEFGVGLLIGYGTEAGKKPPHDIDWNKVVGI